MELNFGTPVLADEMASHWFRLRQVFRLAGILLAAEILLSLPGSAAMAMTLDVARLQTRRSNSVEVHLRRR